MVLKKARRPKGRFGRKRAVERSARKRGISSFKKRLGKAKIGDERGKRGLGKEAQRCNRAKGDGPRGGWGKGKERLNNRPRREKGGRHRGQKKLGRKKREV